MESGSAQLLQQHWAAAPTPDLLVQALAPIGTQLHFTGHMTLLAREQQGW